MLHSRPMNLETLRKILYLAFDSGFFLKNTKSGFLDIKIPKDWKNHEYRTLSIFIIHWDLYKIKYKIIIQISYSE